MLAIEEYAAKIYNNFEELEAENLELGEELRCNIIPEEWQNDELYVYDSIEDYAYYELTEGWYFDNKLAQSDYRGAPNLLKFIDLNALGWALTNSWDDSCHYLSEHGQVVTSGYGWNRKY
ncbi:hypothetical protein LMB49_03885 [Limosilactobacillus reuteri]|uniref:hypothetical protein n=1 Tax=Limosilactobacillus reuteri TaxID=1598 RepID=UPI001E3CB12F|nr:hypothetical protein [Limosilactobacillus reuteri]MCC4370538.1 hypothetical protein [Limosilactobacillus reuteri]MCC4509407.1 hypothetical protein [Limosilactobacillus reuteri]